MNKNHFSQYVLVGVIAACATTLLLGSAFIALLSQKPEVVASILKAPIDPAVVSSEATASVSADSLVIDAVKRANPAVVAITVSRNVPVYERYYESVPFEDFFGDSFFFSVPQLRQQGTELQEIGGGSGFLVSEDGYIVTNRHVVSDESAQYTVFTNDGKSYPATVVARDPSLDISIIKIEGSGFEHLTFANSDTLQVGQSVIAIGNALAEFRNTVSVGVVSGLSRSIVASDGRGRAESLEQLIQTDAAINQGNSGGPLLNLNGEVVGVNVAIVSGAQNVGFALSSNSVKSVVESVKRTGRIVRPYLGVRYVPITPAVQEEHDLPVDYGVWVRRGVRQSDTAVVPLSPADKAGIVEGDIILQLDMVKITPEQSLASMLRTKNVGDLVSLTVLRDGEEKNITVILEEMDV